MAEQELFKNQLDAARVRKIARAIEKSEPSFPAERFARSASRGLEQLELKARVGHIIAALAAHLPEDFPGALEVLLAAGRDSIAEGTGSTLRGFAAWPLIDYIGERGQQHPELALEALRELTGLFSAEFAIRPFVQADPKACLRRITSWTQHADADVRRLCSEGIRPRLPWGLRLQEFVHDPEPVIRILQRLKDDPSEYVRRSVANNLNDIGKDHPERVVELCEQWSPGASAELQWIIRHGTRSLIKAGHPGALRVLGFDPKAKVQVERLELSAPRIRIGQDLTLRFDLRSLGEGPQRLVVDYVVHHIKKNGSRTPKVFKLKTFTLAPGEVQTLRKVHKVRPISTRVYYPGRHTIEVQVNGSTHAQADFDLRT